MYDFLDRPVTSLDDGGRFLVWALRTWVKALGQEVCPATVVGPAFARCKMIAGLAAFHRIMLLLNAHGLETMRFCSLGCNRVSEHEALVISLVRGMHALRPEAIHGAVSQVIDDDQLPALIENLSGMANAMAAAEMLPSR